ncbi:hypothetical protein [Metallosphaera hakonensis]|uniref:Uncharacterized protein n=1 Tax=Metallosphaera hakonensis JCM 8857 = DSM 7519 TaxID=1293036 RepID=A0A2U9IUG4_9CREN|nr:hypothetical protein [Metallosphaera hakonensis]AWR99689.1 hypothetical protein DFR87_08295 [Metallosphaera hakonensis JCM 8857 = DSM 7519]
MKNKKVLLKVEDPKFFIELYHRLKHLGIDVSTDSGTIVVSDSGEGDVVISPELGLSKATAEIYLKVIGKQKFDELLIGIDTNQERLTVVVLADGELLEHKELSLEESPAYINSVISEYPYTKLYIGVGVGNVKGLNAYKFLKKYFAFAKMVNESKTNSKSPYVSIKDRDLRAAYAIALRSTI